MREIQTSAGAIFHLVFMLPLEIGANLFSTHDKSQQHLLSDEKSLASFYFAFYGHFQRGSNESSLWDKVRDNCLIMATVLVHSGKIGTHLGPPTVPRNGLGLLHLLCNCWQSWLILQNIVLNFKFCPPASAQSLHKKLAKVVLCAKSYPRSFV